MEIYRIQALSDAISAATVAYVILCPRLPDQLAERIEALQYRDFL